MKKRSSVKIGLTELMEKWRKRKRGHFAVYTREGERFVLPLEYLNHPIFQVLLEMAEEEFGTTVCGPLRVPCEEVLLKHIVMLVKRNLSGHDDGDGDGDDDTEKAIVASMRTCKGASISSLLPLFRGHSLII
ncbi:PREDICTED: auxin-responsive protein SAUR66-like [Tarenaya hassleriana]|uniref:auxin-responsive protein SAUR66-like n=1 Tax=Tarenaya hassleriana TaxID=28532 RepID=UPI00053C3869|nr:PREDICTED: auxin-responsive protein SAUR66-like [Tarenaya hassleriana]